MSIAYELLGKPQAHSPRRAYGQTRVTVTLQPRGGGVPLRLVAEIGGGQSKQPILRSLHLRE